MHPSHQKRIAIIGAGPAGLTAAYQLVKEGQMVDLFEASGAVGGMSKTLELWGQLVDLGPHRFFTKDPRINNIWQEALDGDFAMVDRLTRIYYRKTFFYYPLRALNALSNLGLYESAQSIASYVKARLSPIRDESNFENWVVNRFGRRLFNIFFKSYSEKLWGIPCSELDADFAAQRIKKFSLMEAIWHTLLPFRKSGHKTLVDHFAYPALGCGLVYERMASAIRNSGGNIFLNTPVTLASKHNDTQGIELILPDGTPRTYDHYISSMPLTLLVKQLNPPPNVANAASHLRFRNTILVYLEITGANPFPDQWIYVHATELNTGRISNFRNWVPSINRGLPSAILCLEYWCYDADAIWQEADEVLIQQAQTELLSTGLVTGDAIQRGHVVRLHRSYPVYDRGYKTAVETVSEYLKTFTNLQAIGRYGAFKYNNQDHSILMGILAAENLTRETKHDLWTVNADDEYQEQPPAPSVPATAKA